MLVFSFKKIRERRQALGMSLIDLEKASKINRGTLSDIENGKRTPRVDKIGKLSEALQVSPSFFFERKAGK